ncbi:hypothetical protein MA16_Dca022420 [Dendrobium catenatum]|uniref:Uncharacterized protein n=1 Tax=Dendrobium catenatum TaxID=906689 RepID=A0A2I0W1Y7_9ASPA|nr:hypothetical protein MA16_Dca022420 [Dendrobium catenatum]
MDGGGFRQSTANIPSKPIDRYVAKSTVVLNEDRRGGRLTTTSFHGNHKGLFNEDPLVIKEVSDSKVKRVLSMIGKDKDVLVEENF